MSEEVKRVHVKSKGKKFDIAFDALRVVTHFTVATIAFINRDKFVGNDKFVIGGAFGMNLGGGVWALCDLIRDCYDYQDEKSNNEQRESEESQ